MQVIFFLLGEPPRIIKGTDDTSLPTVVANETQKVTIGTPVYAVTGSNVIINCTIDRGTRPITISWYRNGVLDSTRGNVSIITITNATDGDNFTCEAQNSIGFDSSSTIITIKGNNQSVLVY